MNTNNLVLFILVAIIIVSLAACMPGGGDFYRQNPAGFLFGVWHGWIAPVSLIISFFNSSVRIYEVNNTGFWYDFGFYIAIISGFGGISLTRKKWKSNKNN